MTAGWHGRGPRSPVTPLPAMLCPLRLGHCIVGSVDFEAIVRSNTDYRTLSTPIGQKARQTARFWAPPCERLPYRAYYLMHRSGPGPIRQRAPRGLGAHCPVRGK